MASNSGADLAPTLTSFLQSLELQELLALRRDLSSGCIVIKRELAKRIQEERKQHASHCTTCQAPIDPSSASTFTVLFGPDDFKKRASFCAMDCMSYFMERLKNERNR
ncbi:MAG: hypothetical protein V1735_03725 [Nanoarchaeota archaeon]